MLRFQSKYCHILTGCFLIFLQSCINESIDKIASDTAIIQNFSIPLGETSLSLNKFDPANSGNTPGKFGSFYYNNIKFPNNLKFFTKTAQVEFNLNDNQNRQTWITKIDFNFLVRNYFPSDMFLQVYVLDASKRSIDSLFKSGQVLISAADINTIGEAISPSSKTFLATFEGDRLDLLKTSNCLLYQITVNTQNSKTDAIRLNDDSKAIVNTGVRIQLKYNLQDATQ